MHDASSASKPSADSLLAQANFAIDEERWVDAATLSLQGLGISREPLQKGWLYLALGRARWHLGAIPACCRSAIQAEGLARLAGDDGLLIDAGTLAAFSLSEIGLSALALDFALPALEAARRPGLHDRLPLALSCAALVYAGLGDLFRTEECHMHALSHARENGGQTALSLAYGNLLHSFGLIAMAAQAQGDADGLAAVGLRLKLYSGHIRSCMRRADLEEWRIANLMIGFGAILSLFPEGEEESEQLLSDGLLRGERLGRLSYEVVEARQALAKLRLRQRRFEEALQFLPDAAANAARATGWHQNEVQSLRIVHACYEALGRVDEADALARRMDASERDQAQTRDQILRFVSGARRQGVQ